MDEGGVDAPVIHPPGWDPNSTALALQAGKEGLSRPLPDHGLPMTSSSLQTAEWELRATSALQRYEGHGALRCCPGLPWRNMFTPTRTAGTAQTTQPAL